MLHCLKHEVAWDTQQHLIKMQLIYTARGPMRLDCAAICINERKESELQECSSSVLEGKSLKIISWFQSMRFTLSTKLAELRRSRSSSSVAILLDGLTSSTSLAAANAWISQLTAASPIPRLSCFRKLNMLYKLPGRLRFLRLSFGVLDGSDGDVFVIVCLCFWRRNMIIWPLVCQKSLISCGRAGFFRCIWQNCASS